MIRVAPEGRPFIAVAWLLVAVLAGVGQWWVLGIWLPLAVWVVAFFRDPERLGPRGVGLVLAPADGKIVGIGTVDEPGYLGPAATRISIFMNVFNVHVNRYPAGGTVEYRHYHPGRFGNAGGDKASLDNEQSTLGLRSARGRLTVRQIAGLVARRIVTDHQVGMQVIQGERMGLIRFGSRVDVFLPATARLLVQAGQRTVAGVTVVAQWD